MRATAALVVLAVAFLAGCAREEKEPRLPPLTADKITGDVLWNRIENEANWDSYGHWPGVEGLVPGQPPHGKFHEIYVNAPLLDALPIASKVAPEGSIIVKENFDADKKPTDVAVMAKVKGYDPAHGDWFWASFTPEGKVISAGKVQTCIACHEGMKSNDYIVIHQLDEPLGEAEKSGESSGSGS
jgi:hypothetical protein